MEFLTKSGKQVVLNFAGFKDASELKRQIEKELLKVNLDIGKFEKDLMKLEIGPEFLNTFKNLFLIVDSSKEVEDCLFKCLARSTYNGEKITYETFNNEEAVKDYYEIVVAGLKRNLEPFFGNLISGLSGVLNQAVDSLKSKLQPTSQQ